MGEALLKHAIVQLPADSPLKKLRVISAGTFGEDGMDATSDAIIALQKIGVELKGHVAQSISKRLLDSCFCLVAMTRNHLSTVQSRFPQNMPPHVFALLSVDPAAKNKDVMDPWGYDLHTYMTVRDEINAAIPHLVQYLQKEFK